MQAEEGMPTQVEGPDCGKELKREEEEALEELSNPEWLKCRLSAELGQQSWRKAQKNLSGSGCLWFHYLYISTLYIGESQPWLQSESPGGLLQHLIPDTLYQNICTGDPDITSSPTPSPAPGISTGQPRLRTSVLDHHQTMSKLVEASRTKNINNIVIIQCRFEFWVCVICWGEVEEFLRGTNMSCIHPQAKEMLAA